MTLRNVPAIPRPDAIVTDGRITTSGYAYLAELEKVLGEVRNLLEDVQEIAEASATDLLDIQSGGLGKLIYQGQPKYAEDSGVLGGGATYQIGAVSHRASRAGNIIGVRGNMQRTYGTASTLVDGFSGYLLVDGQQTGQAIVDWSLANTHLSTSFSFYYIAPDAETHTFDIEMTSSSAARYAPANWFEISEYRSE